MTKRDGGPAFPLAVARTNTDYQVGMSLRDWFAGQAATRQFWSTFADAEQDEISETVAPSEIARKAYALADAMLVEREK